MLKNSEFNYKKTQFKKLGKRFEQTLPQED